MRMTLLNKTCGLLAVCLMSLPCAASAWEPGDKELEAVLKSGEFGVYFDNISKWLDQKAPADKAKMTEAAIADLVKEPVLRKALNHRRLMESHGTNNLSAFVKDEAKRKFLAWVMNSTEMMDLYLEPAAPGIDALERWFKLYTAYPDTREGTYLRLTMAAAIWPAGGSGQYRSSEPIEWEKRYKNYKDAHAQKLLVPSFDHLTVADYARCMSCIGADTDINWARQMIRAWRPDLLEKEQIHKIVSEVWRRFSPFGFTNGFITVMEGGGKCGPRGIFGQFVNNAMGVPAIGVGQPKHCTFAARCDYPETEPQVGSLWKVYQGRGWQVSDCGGCYGPQFVEQMTRQYRTAEVSLIVHMNWLASSLSSKERADALRELARKVPKPVNTQDPYGVPASEVDVAFFGKGAKTDPSKKDAKIDFDAEGPGVATSASKTHGRPPRIKEDPIVVAPGVIHVEAETFTNSFADPLYPNEQEGAVFEFDCATGGKQIYFQRNMKVSWVDYSIEVPEAGIYALEIMYACANRDMVLEISSGDEKLGTVKIPGTTGLWRKMDPADIKLKKGVQPFRITSPQGQRGISIRWFELTPKK